MDSDSDNDEGFVANRIQIQPTQKKTKQEKRNQRPIDFQARYICGDRFLRYD